MWLASRLQVTASASIETSCELGNGADPVESPWIMFNDLLCVGDSGLVDDQAVFEARTQTTVRPERAFSSAAACSTSPSARLLR